MAKYFQPMYTPPRIYTPFINDESETAPPFALLEVVTFTDGVMHCRKPTKNGNNDLFINGDTPTPSEGTGQCHQSFPCPVAFEPSEGDSYADPTDGEVWGSLSGSWHLHKHMPGFRIIGGASDGVVNVIRSTASWAAIVRVVGTGGGGSGSGSGGAGRYDGYLQTFDPVTRAYTDGEAIWIECDPNSDVDVGYVQGIHVGFAESRLVFFVDRSWINDAGSGSGSGGDCRTTLGGVTISNLGVLTSPTHVLGIDANGCIGLIELTEC